MSVKTISNDCEELIPQTIEVKGIFDIGVITGVTFPKCNMNDKVCIHYTFWDHRRNELCKTSITYNNIYTYRKHQFQKFCEDFQIITDDKIDFSELIGCCCVTLGDLYCGITLGVIMEEDEDNYPYLDEAVKQLQNVEFDETVNNIPYKLKHYWYNPHIDQSDLRHQVYHGMITRIEWENYKNDGDKVIVYVAVFSGGRPIEYRYFINNNHDDEINRLMRLLGAEDSYKELIYTPVDVKLFQTKSEKLYVNAILRPRFKADSEDKQVDMLINDYRKFLKNNEDNIRDYNER